MSRALPFRARKAAVLLVALAGVAASMVSPAAAKTTAGAATPTCVGVRVQPGADVQAAINANPVRTRFCFDSGTYSVPAALRPKEGQQFVALVSRGAIFTGNGTTTVAFDAQTVANVQLEGLVVERFATPAQGGMAAVRIGTGGIITNSEVRLNSYSGIYHANYVRLVGNYIHHNFSGITSFKTVGAVIENNEVAFNNVTNTRPDGGGSKWTGTRDLTVRGNNFHDNTGTGIWVDGDNINVLIENNRSNNNTGLGGKGIQYEISCAGVVRNNTLTGNATSGIELVASQNVEVYGNTLSGNANGIRVWHQQRGAGTNCPWVLKNVVVRNNSIDMTRGASGLWKYNVNDGDTVFSPTDGRVSFRSNSYRLSGTAKYLQWSNSTRTVQEWKAYGQDTAGTFVTTATPPPPTTTTTTAPPPPPTTTTTAPPPPPTTTTTAPPPPPTTTTTTAPPPPPTTTTTAPPPPPTTTTTTAPPPPPTPTCVGVRVQPGADVQAAINANPVRTRFCFDSGTYSVPAALRPKEGQQFVALVSRGAIFTGNGTTTVAFDAQTVANVQLEGLVVERFATPAQGGMAAVRIGTGGIITNSEVRLNSYSGIYHANYVRLVGNYIHHNFSGITSFKTVGAVIENNEVAFNNVTNTRPDGGGSKWTGTRDLTVRGNNFHDNTGTGIWVDGDNINVLIENNRSNNNTGLGGKGIQYEISCAGVVRNNTLTGNATSGIELVASQNVEVYGNTLSGNANGIRVWHQQRGAGTNCPWVLKNVVVRNNSIDMTRGASGLWKYNVNDGDTVFSPTDGRVSFRSNSYRLSGTAKYLQWSNSTRTVQEWKAYGQDTAGTFVTA